MRNCSTCGTVQSGREAPIDRVAAGQPREATAAAPVDSDSFSIVGFDDRITTYTLTLQSIDFDGATVAVVAEMARDGTSAFVDSMQWRLFVGGAEVDAASRSAEGTVTLSGPATSGDTVAVVMETGQFGGHSATVQGSIGSGGNGGGGDGLAGAGIGLLVLAGLVLRSRSKAG